MWTPMDREQSLNFFGNVIYYESLLTSLHGFVTRIRARREHSHFPKFETRIESEV